MVATMSRIGPARALDLLGEDAARRAELLTAVEMLVLEAGQDSGGETEPAPHAHALRVTGAGLVERAGDWRAPVQHQRLTGVVDDVPPADVVAPAGVIGGSAVEVETAEEQRGGGIVGQLGDPAGQRATERLGRVGVAGYLVAGGEQGFGALAHAAQGRPRDGQVALLLFEVVVEVGYGHDGILTVSLA
jgi:hypothetical protein